MTEYDVDQTGRMKGTNFQMMMTTKITMRKGVMKTMRTTMKIYLTPKNLGGMLVRVFYTSLQLAF